MGDLGCRGQVLHTQETLLPDALLRRHYCDNSPPHSVGLYSQHHTPCAARVDNTETGKGRGKREPGGGVAERQESSTPEI